MDFARKLGNGLLDLTVALLVLLTLMTLCGGCAAVGEWPPGPRVEGPDGLVLEYGGCTQASYRTGWSRLSSDMHWYYVRDANGNQMARAWSFVPLEEFTWSAFAEAWPEKAREVGQ